MTEQSVRQQICSQVRRTLTTLMGLSVVEVRSRPVEIAGVVEHSRGWWECVVTFQDGSEAVGSIDLRVISAAVKAGEYADLIVDLAASDTVLNLLWRQSQRGKEFDAKLIALLDWAEKHPRP